MKEGILMTPMMTQYLQTKEQYQDHLLFYRLGDFYEMFFEDAKTASRELDLVLTGRDCGEAERAPMCGIPFHSADQYITRLVEKGYKVAICEQTEDPAQAVGLVKREVVKIITPGTAVGQNLTNETKNNYLAALCMNGDHAACAFCDISENTVYAVTLADSSPLVLMQKINNELSLFSPSELLFNLPAEDCASLISHIKRNGRCRINDNIPDIFDADLEFLKKHFSLLPEFEDQHQKNTCLGAVCAVMHYLEATQKTALVSINTLKLYNKEGFVCIDSSSRRNLELCETLRLKEKRGSLLWVLDKTKTAAGARMLRRFILQPLTNCKAIQDRQSAVSELYEDLMLKDSIRDTLSNVQDIERLLSKVTYGKASPRDLLALKSTLENVPEVAKLLENARSEELGTIYRSLSCDNKQTVDDLIEQIEVSIDPDAPISTKDGGVIRTGFNQEVDDLRSILTETNRYLASIEASEKELTGIKTLKVSYNRVFGYYIEVTKSALDAVPDRYIRKQTLTNCERYITEELKQLEARILGAKDRIAIVETQIFEEILQVVISATSVLQAISELLARLDVYASLAQVAMANHYVCPEVDYSDVLELKDSRHPVAEKLVDTFFVPNDIYLDTSSHRMAIITGPNMAGKSTYMRQVALITLMAQMGSYVPAKSARIGIVDKIFTRVGASDDLSTGQSTFMLEMNEVAYILKNATQRSLILYDEIGRGTSTYDGMSIARAVVEYTAGKKIGARTLFATHYHELSELEQTTEGVKNFNIATKKRGEEILFLRKIVPGSADQSYGIEVAKLAGVPNEVIKRAKVILNELEQSHPDRPQLSPIEEPVFTELTLFDQGKDRLVEELKKINPDTLTPIEALGLLYELNKKAQKI